ncbi:SF1B family DNA helicase RecD2 [Carboxydothermus ferrireducens]|uniref:ATP-dependent RecD2 DNA helicase n=1 Tax=Carboxydothermus ferrireducens DSM 11255 TaxID=1119529 RepID=A0ABX2RCB4_9THEO|nr:ATP-dependent RecD-like DNA helicase [Carboxydothermus ferrireducens]NYE58565.1 exodeoxyribonuclease V alpha subunit [Carboxydothermus ferrireducens DSM 11255]
MTRNFLLEETINVEVKYIKFSRENFIIAGAKILEGERQGEIIDILGEIINCRVGERYRVSGKFVNNPNYGLQFQVKYYERERPNSPEQLISYLSNLGVKGIGEKTAAKIVERFGMDALTVILKDFSQLTKIRGISFEKAESLYQKLKEEYLFEEAFNLLAPLNLEPHQIKTLLKFYRESLMEHLKENPYKPIHELYGFAFAPFDKLAKDWHFPPNHLYRIKASIVYVLKEALEQGHVYLPLAEVYNKGLALLGEGIGPETVDEGLSVLLTTGEVCLERDRLYLKKLYDAEKTVARKVAFLLTITDKKINIKKSLAEVEKKLGISYDPLQKEALSLMFAEKKLFILTGGPGTGKTTVIKGFIELYQRFFPKNKIALAAPTGRAAKRLSESTGMPAATIHRLLEPEGETRSGELLFRYNKYEPLPYDLIIIDEVSMLDLPLAAALFEAITPECRLVLVGDPNQLPPVGPGQLLKDLLAVEEIPRISLKTVFRQGEDAGIIEVAHRVLTGDWSELERLLGGRILEDVFFLPAKDTENITNLLLKVVKKLWENYGYSPEDIAVLSPMRKGALGVENLNVLLQKLFNGFETQEVKFFGTSFKVNDKVMQIKNNYERGEDGVFNGETGFIKKIIKSGDEEEIIVSFDGKNIKYRKTDLEELTLSYATTVHKAQGMEYPVVILVLHNYHYPLLKRNLLYTAVTRAKKMLIVIGTPWALRQAVENIKEETRYSSLPERLGGVFEKGDLVEREG